MEPPRYINADEVRIVLTWPIVINAVEQALVAISNRNMPTSILATRPHAFQPTRTITQGRRKSDILLSMPGYVGNYKLKCNDDNATNANANNNEQEQNDNDDDDVAFGQKETQNDQADASKLVCVDNKHSNSDGDNSSDSTADNESGAFTINHTLACKLVTSYPNNERYNLPNIMANILLFDNQTGQLKCIMDGTQITAWRTAAASVIATKFLYFRRFGPKGELENTINVGIIGCGVQGESHALAMCATFKVANIYLWNRTFEKANALGRKLIQMSNSEEGAKWPVKTTVYVCEDVRDLVSEVDVICIATYSASSLINYRMLHKKRNLHINAIGAGQVHFGEVDADIYEKGVVYVDSVEAAQVELKDLNAKIIGEIGGLIRDSAYLTSTTGITIFQSMGVAAEDVTVSQAVYNALKEKSII